jgi:hypothetical protein
MTSSTTGALGAAVDQAAGLLAAIGRLTAARTDQMVRLRCLLAADGLGAAGAIPADVAPLGAEPDAIAGAIHTALGLLAELPADVFATEQVADAAADARSALAALS